MKNVAIIGQGEIGSAIAHLLSVKKDVVVRTWDADPEKSQNATTCETAVIGADLIIVAIPTRALRTCFSTLKQLLAKESIVISVAKGMDGDPPKFVSELLEEFFGPERIGILSGPMLAEELFSGKIGEAVIAAEDNIGESIEEIFQETILRVIPTDDIIGVSVSGVLKNIYSTGIGMIEGLELGANARGMFVQRAVNEMAKILEDIGGNKNTAFGPAGLGDLIATGTSKHSTNYAYGKQFVRGESAKKGEGAYAIASVAQRLDVKKCPILDSVSAILSGRRSIKTLRRFYE